MSFGSRAGICKRAGEMIIEALIAQPDTMTKPRFVLDKEYVFEH